LWQKHSVQHAIACSAAIGLPIAVAGVTPFLASGYIVWSAGLSIILTSIPAAYFAAQYTHRWRTIVIQRILSGVVLLVGLGLVIST
jgi:uncharacterized protein